MDFLLAAVRPAGGGEKIHKIEKKPFTLDQGLL